MKEKQEKVVDSKEQQKETLISILNGEQTEEESLISNKEVTKESFDIQDSEKIKSASSYQELYD